MPALASQHHAAVGDEEPLTSSNGARRRRRLKFVALDDLRTARASGCEALGIPSKEQSSTHTSLAGAYAHCLQAFGRGTLLPLLYIDPETASCS